MKKSKCMLLATTVMLGTATSLVHEYEPIAAYVPGSNVTEHSRIDFDQAELEMELAELDYSQAKAIYTNGKHSSKSSSLRTLAAFSTAAGTKMRGEAMFELYSSYWGSDTYAHNFVMSALEGTGSFQGKPDIVRVECAKKGTAYQHVWMYVLHEIEDAIKDCLEGTQHNNDLGVHAWDEAWAFYAGSLEGRDGTGSGKLLYALADKRCAHFNTCELGVQGTSLTNLRLLLLFAQGKSALKDGNCAGAQGLLGPIRAQMTVPLLQGTLRYMYEADPQAGGGGDKQWAEGWAFLSSVLPQIDACDKDVAAALVKNLDIAGETALNDGFRVLKTKLESVYTCLNVSSLDVGGYVESVSDTGIVTYKTGMESVAQVPSEPADSLIALRVPAADVAKGVGMPGWAMGLLSTMLFLLGLALGVVIANHKRKKYAELPQEVAAEESSVLCEAI